MNNFNIDEIYALKSEFLLRYNDIMEVTSFYEDSNYYQIKCFNNVKCDISYNNIPNYILLIKVKDNEYMELLTKIPVVLEDRNLRYSYKERKNPVFFESINLLNIVNNINSKIILKNYTSNNLKEILIEIYDFYYNAWNGLNNYNENIKKDDNKYMELIKKLNDNEGDF